MRRLRNYTIEDVHVVLVLLLTVILILSLPVSVMYRRYFATAGFDSVSASRLVVIGDSYSHGSDEGGRGTASWVALLAERRGWNWKNEAIGGTGYVHGRGEDQNFGGVQLEDALSASPDVLIVAGSRNDVPESAKDVYEAADEVFSKVSLLSPSTRVLVIGPIWSNMPEPPNLAAVRDAVILASRQHGYPYVDPVAEKWFNGDFSSLIGEDEVHPTDEGNEYLASRIGTVLQQQFPNLN